jgi:PAS domain S-box-containing protein
MGNAHVVTAADSTAEMLRLAAEMLDVGIVVVDRDLRIVRWNAWLENASGIPASAVVNQPLTSLGPDVINAVGEAAFLRALAGGTVIHSHRFHRWLLRFPPPSGYAIFTDMQQSARIAPLVRNDGTVLGAVAFIEDVTERVAAEDELRAATAAAHAANKAKSDFLAAMSHELRTPIGAISGYADLLVDGIIGPVSDAQRDHLGRIKTVSHHLLRVVDEILTFARLDAHAEEAHVKRVDAAQVARDAATAIEPLARRKGLRLSMRCPQHAVFVETDETKLRQILINLMGNAVKFTEQGSVTLEMEAPADQDLRVSVTDTGPGISPDDLERIFEPFVQGRSSHSRSYEGTGLGLSVSRQFAHLLGGDLSVRSEVGRGSTFVVTIPTRGPSPTP